MRCCLFQSFSLAGRIYSRGFTVLTDFDFYHLSLYSLKSWSCCFMHTFLLIFCGFCSWLAGFDLWCDWAFSLTSFETYSAVFLLLRLNNPLIEVLGSYAGVFRGARLSSLTTLTPAQPRPTFLSLNLANHIVLSKLWKLGLDRCNNYSVCMKHWQSFMTSTKC